MSFVRNRVNSNRNRSETIKEFCDNIGVSKEGFLLYNKENEKEYKVFDLIKKNGSLRKVKAPSAGLAGLQRKISKILQTIYNQPNCVHGYVPDRSVVSNAQCHVNKRYILSIDINDFFWFNY